MIYIKIYNNICRWEVIDVVRTLSTEKVKAGEEGSDSFKFSRFVSYCTYCPFNWYCP